MDKQTRQYDFRVARADEEGDGLTLEGYASVFNEPTDIRDFLGTYEETIAPGAFKKTLAERTPVLQFDHGSHPLIGSIPLGSIRKIVEDETGLFVRARLSDNWLVQPVRDAIHDGAINGMSFQFEVTREEWNKDQTARTVREVKLYELGPVVFPAYPQTTVGVRSEIKDLLACDSARSDIARALCFPTIGERSTDADPVTSVEADDTPPSAPVVPDRKAAAAALKLSKKMALGSDYISKGA